MGSAFVAGYDIIDQSLEVRRLVGYVPETIPLDPDMSVFEHLKFMVVVTMFMLKVNH